MPRFGGVLGAEQTDLELWEQTKHIARSTNGESEKDEIGAVTSDGAGDTEVRELETKRCHKGGGETSRSRDDGRGDKREQVR